MIKLSHRLHLGALLLLVLFNVLTTTPVKGTISGKEKPGSYTLQFGLGVPSYSDIKGYQETYGEPPTMFSSRIDYYFNRQSLQFGLGLGFGVSQDKGKTFAADNPESVDLDKVNTRGGSDLLLIPLQLNFTIQYSPAVLSWLRLQAWFGREFMYFFERRRLEGDNVPYTSVWLEGNSFGFALQFRIDQFDHRAAQSLATVGFKKIYLSPFVEVVSETSPLTQGARSGILSRNMMGLLFTFETIN